MVFVKIGVHFSIGDLLIYWEVGRGGGGGSVWRKYKWGRKEPYMTHLLQKAKVWEIIANLF